MEISIETQHLRKEYPGRVALEDISFKVAKGTIHGFLGPNGAGKTTTMKILTGLIGQSAGEVKINGRIGFLPENPPVYGNMTVDDYLTFVLNIYSKEKFDSARIKKVKEQCGLTEVGDRLITNLSKGFKQRVGIAQALVHSPEIIILDEPTVGLDPVAIVEIRNLIESLKGDHTILFSSHQLHEVELLCQEITLVDKGKVLISGTLSDIQNSLTTKRRYLAVIRNYSPELEKDLCAKLPIDSVELINKEKNSFQIGINCNAKFNEDQHATILTEILTEKRFGLLSFHEEKLDLEEIFKKMTIKKEVR
jgi:ABC-2 type transport system ATP-binding protein